MSLAADDPSHRRIMAQPLGVIDVLVSGKPTEHRLPQHTDKSVPAVLAGACVGEPLAGQIRKAQCVV
jgi:ligand-binding sensor protein